MRKIKVLRKSGQCSEKIRRESLYCAADTLEDLDVSGISA